jgi:anti-sigma regulatory factor (Ser/Thr protein kinase)
MVPVTLPAVAGPGVRTCAPALLQVTFSRVRIWVIVRRPVPPTFRLPVALELPPSAAYLPAVRHTAERAFDGIPDQVASDALLALGEAVANAIRHGSGAGRSIHVAVIVDHGWIEMSVRDQGPTTLPPRLPSDPPAPLALGGRGLWMILQLVDEVRLSRSGNGTLLRLRRRIQPRHPPRRVH